MTYRHLSVALPMMGELDNLQPMLSRLRGQSFKSFSLYVCVNQAEGDATYLQDNLLSLRMLREVTDMDVHIIDRCSPGCGWQGKQRGVGWARKLLFDAIAEKGPMEEVIVSLDADTSFDETYLESVLCAFNQHLQWDALAVPYYHPLSHNNLQDRAMLRYECYMHYYLINLLLIDNPYAFSALGSAMAFPVWAYQRVGGITPLQGGEDFYLMQKFAKTGMVGLHLPCCVYPQGRPSTRVPFGTGPAIAKGVDSMDNSYPFYPEEAFLRVSQTFAAMPALYEREEETTMSPFLRQQLKTEELWAPIRKNFKSVEHFVHACQEKVDGLRILQYLKTQPRHSDSVLHLIEFCKHHSINLNDGFSFSTTPVEQLNQLRDVLFQREMNLRKQKQ